MLFTLCFYFAAGGVLGVRAVRRNGDSGVSADVTWFFSWGVRCWSWYVNKCDTTLLLGWRHDIVVVTYACLIILIFSPTTSCPLHTMTNAGRLLMICVLIPLCLHRFMWLQHWICKSISWCICGAADSCRPWYVNNKDLLTYSMVIHFGLWEDGQPTSWCQRKKRWLPLYIGHCF